MPTPSGTASEACGKNVPKPSEGFHTIQAGGKDRRFYLRIPAAYDGKQPWPVVFAFHGAGDKDGSWFNGQSYTTANKDNAVLVFPESGYRDGTGGTRSWQPEDQLPGNLALVDGAVEWVKKNLCVTTNRFFALGQSSGAYFAQTLGCHRGDVFRAVASSDGGERYFKDCKGNPGAYIRYRATGQNAADSIRARDFIIQRNGCSMNKVPTEGPPCEAYTGCRGDLPLWECKDDGEHAMPKYMDLGTWKFFSLFK